MSTSVYHATLARQNRTPQNEAIPGEPQVANNAGGFVYELDPWKVLERFLILGTEGGTFYATEQKLTADAAANVRALIAQDYVRVVDTTALISDRGRAPRNTPAEFVLALVASDPRPEARAYALAALPKVCRIPTHLYHFMQFVTDMRGWSRGLRKAVSQWLDRKNADQLAYAFAKYQQRDGWSGADVIRLAHPRTTDAAKNAVYRWMLGKHLGAMTIDRNGRTTSYEALPEFPRILVGMQLAHAVKDDSAQWARLVREYGLTREMLPTEALGCADVWRALFDAGMPYTALLRNLGNLSAQNVLTPLSAVAKATVAQLSNVDALRAARVHPMAVLLALRTYATGHGLRGKNYWKPVPAVIDALNDAFYASFENAEPTGKNILYAVDVSASMTVPIANYPISSAEVAAVMAMVLARKERNYYIHGFCHEFVDLKITNTMTLDRVTNAVQRSNFGGTDCAVPYAWAKKNRVDVDAVVVITDNETWAGVEHPRQALRDYRKARQLATKQIVVATTPTKFSIADPTDPLSLDVVGFDAAVPAVVSDFIRQ